MNDINPIVILGFKVFLITLPVLLLTVYVILTERKTITFYFTCYFNIITTYFTCFFKKIKWLFLNKLKALLRRNNNGKNFFLSPNTRFYNIKKKRKSFSYYFSLDYLKIMPADPYAVVIFTPKKDKVKKVPFFIFFLKKKVPRFIIFFILLVFMRSLWQYILGAEHTLLELILAALSSEYLLGSALGSIFTTYLMDSGDEVWGNRGRAGKSASRQRLNSPEWPSLPRGGSPAERPGSAQRPGSPTEIPSPQRPDSPQIPGSPRPGSPAERAGSPQIPGSPGERPGSAGGSNTHGPVSAEQSDADRISVYEKNWKDLTTVVREINTDLSSVTGEIKKMAQKVVRESIFLPNNSDDKQGQWYSAALHVYAKASEDWGRRRLAFADKSLAMLVATPSVEQAKKAAIWEEMKTIIRSRENFLQQKEVILRKPGISHPQRAKEMYTALNIHHNEWTKCWNRLEPVLAKEFKKTGCYTLDPALMDQILKEQKRVHSEFGASFAEFKKALHPVINKKLK